MSQDLNEGRRNEIAWLIDIADGDRQPHNLAGWAANIGMRLREAERKQAVAKEEAQELHRMLQHRLGDKTPTEEELLAYGDALSKEIQLINEKK